jgi:GH24 family phage-related lysozyme (muramidase)
MTDTWGMAEMVKQLIPEEAVRLYVYDDATGQAIRAGTVCRGNPTIGIGRNLAANGISAAEADLMCVNDINRVAADLDNRLSWWRKLSPVRQRQILDLAFNMGVGGLLNFTHFLAAMQAGHWPDAVAELQQSHWWQEVGTRGPAIADRILTG